MREKFATFLFLILFALSNANAGNLKLDAELLQACKRGDTKRVETLLKEGANPNAKDSFGSTCLMIAAANGYVDVLKLLILHGANINETYNGKGLAGLEGETALHYAIEGYSWDRNKNKEKCAIYLVNHGIDLDKRDELGLTYLMLASREGMANLVKELIRKGMNVNEESNKGYTALMLAAMKGHTEIVRILLSHGADPNKKIKKGEYKGYTALKFAEEKGYREIVSLLKEYGAKK